MFVHHVFKNNMRILIICKNLTNNRGVCTYSMATTLVSKLFTSRCSLNCLMAEMFSSWRIRHKNMFVVNATLIWESNKILTNLDSCHLEFDEPVPALFTNQELGFMAAQKENSITDWKKLWQLVSGIHYETPNETVKQKLFDVSKELQDGILQFKKCSTTSADLEKFLKTKHQEKLFPFTNKLQHLLDLQTEQCWDLLCYYLINEYRGSATSLSNFIATESNMTKLLDDIWGYYSLERIIVLKIVKNMVEFHRGVGHPYAKEYKYVLDKISLDKLRQSVLSQLEHLIKENPPTKLAAGEFFNYNSKLVAWSERNSREITEVLHILILLMASGSPNPNEFKQLLDCFRHHSFGRQQRYLDSSNEYHKDLITKIAYSEIAIFMLCTDLSEWQMYSEFVKQTVNTLDRDIVLLHHNPEHGPLLLTWMLLNFRDIGVLEDDEITRKYRQFGIKAVQLNVFKFLKDVVSHKMFKGKSLISQTVQKCVYNHLSHLCDLFDADGSIGQQPYVYDLLCELISSEHIAKTFIEIEEGGVWSLYNTALENFPIDFVNLSMIYYGLSTAGMHEYVINQLENLPIFTDMYEEFKFQLRPSFESEDEFVLQHDYQPFQHIDYTIPAGTNVIVMNKMDRTLVHFRTSLNYFHVLHNEINLLISEAIQYTGLDEDRLKRVNAGVKFLSVSISKIKSPADISQEMVHPTEMCIDILNKLKNLPLPPIELLANCLNVFAALVPLFETEISKRVINLNIFPCLTNEVLDFKKYSHGICFDSNLVGSYLVNFEKKLEKYDFLMAYLNFLRIYSRLGKDKLYSMEIPGLIFLLREVLPHMHSWRFQSPEERNKIYLQIMRYICDVLDIVTTEKSENGNSKALLRDICVYSLLSLDNGIVLLKFVAIGNPFLQHSMENECNWITASTTNILLLVRLAMRILMSLLKLKTTIFEGSAISPLEALIYTQPKQTDTLRIIPIVTSYMSNIFDRWLPILSCRLLRRIALEFKMSLLACLDMEPDQIRLTFLQRLLDDLESDDLKIAILEFIEACIEKQPGLTEAFFKIGCEKDRRLFVKDKTANIGDSILPFMQDYMEAVGKDPSTVEGPLPSRIMSLFHTLWRNNMQSLVQELVNKSTFWSSLCNPMFGTLKKDVKAYSQLLNVLGIELFGCDSNNKLKDDLKKVLQKFFEESYFEKWIDHVFDLPEDSIENVIPEETPEWLSRLQAFKDFVVILLKKKVKTLEVPSKKMKMFAIKCLQILVHRAECTDDLRPFIILSELYLVVLLSFKHSYTETENEDQEMLQNIVKLLNNVALCYDDLHPRAKESCLSIAIKSTELLSTELLKDSMSALQYLNPIVDIICFELNNLEKCVKAEVKQPKTEMQQQQNNSLILSLNLLKTAAVIFSNEGPSNWDHAFISNRILNRLLDCITWILPISSKYKLSNELMDVLIVFAKGNCSMEFIHCDVSGCLWLKLLPPKELLQTPYILQQPKENSWVMQNWWPIYTKGIQLVTILLQKYAQHFLKDALLFVGIHEEYLMDSLLLAKHSLEPNAMNLVKITAEFISNLINYEKEWRLEHSQSLFNLIRCIQTLLHHAISLLYRPKILKRLVDGIGSQPETIVEVSAPFFDEILTAMNDLCEIITFCAQSLLRFSPKLMDLVCESEFLVSRWEPLIEVQFGAPKLDAGSYPQLTFGAVLSAVAILTKALNLQNYGFHDVPLNILPAKSNEGRKDSILSSSRDTPCGSEKGRKRTPSSSRTPFLKSMSVTSMTSISSTTAPSIELLSNIDGELCLISLELILTLLASQSLLALKNTNLSSREKQLIRREISTELIVFHEFVRKKVLIDPNYHKSIWYRRKHGIVMMMDSDGDLSGPKTKQPMRKSSDHKNSMRVNVVRRLHLQQQQQKPSNFEMSTVISPITGPSKKSALNFQALSSTPNKGQKSSEDIEPSHKRSSSLDCEEEEIEYFEPEDPHYSPLSYVQLVEEDYLHFLSNLFTVICQSD